MGRLLANCDVMGQLINLSEPHSCVIIAQMLCKAVGMTIWRSTQYGVQPRVEHSTDSFFSLYSFKYIFKNLQNTTCLRSLQSSHPLLKRKVKHILNQQQKNIYNLKHKIDALLQSIPLGPYLETIIELIPYINIPLNSHYRKKLIFPEDLPVFSTHLTISYSWCPV